MLAITRYTSFMNAYRGIMHQVIKAGGVDTVSTYVSGDDRLPFGLVGYTSDRWIKYTDAYLYGGRPFMDFLAKGTPRKTASCFLFGGKQVHGRGPCIVSLSVSSGVVHVNARTLHWANAAVLDLNLLWLLSRHYQRPIWLTCPRVEVLDWQLANHRLLAEFGNCDFVRKARIIKKHPERLSWDRMRRRVMRDLGFHNQDEEEIVTNFPRVTPEDVARALKISGKTMRHILRQRYGHAIKGANRSSHSWASYDDPRFRSLGLNIKSLPPLDELVQRRVTNAPSI